MDTSFTNSLQSIADARRDSTNWSVLTRADQIRSIELNGFVVIPDILSAEKTESIKMELDRIPTQAVDYSPHQRGCSDVQWTDSPNAVEVIGNPSIVDFLTHLFGDDLICTSCIYVVSEPGHPGIAMHTDAQPYGSKIFGLQSSSPILARVLYYLDDLTPERSPFKVIPRSHLSMHRDANPYLRYLSHPDELMITCKAGSAVIINQKVFHANFPNHCDSDRRMYALAYRPAWSGPIGEVEEWDTGKVASLPEGIQPYFKSLNTRDIEYDLPNRPDGMPRNAVGVSLRRWEGSEPIDY